MKYSWISLLLLVAATTSRVSAAAAVDPCVPDELDNVCIREHDPCKSAESECCDGLGCFGFNFYKSCQAPPTCLKQWYDCSSGLPCCDDLVCAITDSGNHECEEETIFTRKANLQGLTEAPTSAPEPPNLTTKCTGGEPLMIAGVYGDPHMHTFDGLGQDCQAEGEFIMAKSTQTQRRIDGRFAHFTDRFSPGWAWSVVKGVAVRDEGDSPTVEISIPILPETFSPSYLPGGDNCKVLFYVDGQLRDLASGTGREDVIAYTQGVEQIIEYPKTGLKVQVKTGWAQGCFLDVFGFVPKCEGDSTIGLWGNGDGDTSNDWTTRNGELLPVPSDMTHRLRHDGYEYCTQHWCIHDQADSIFTHKEALVQWEEDIHNCNLPYGSTMEEFLETVSPTILDACNSEITCIIDAQIMGIDAARKAANSRGVTTATCNGIGGECDVSRCCNGLTCEEVNAFAKECMAEPAPCVGEWSNCGELQPCCGELVCTDMNGGAKQCRDLPSCMPEWRSCKDIDCCDGLTCVTQPNGQQQCQNLPTCVSEWQPCGIVDGLDCCDGMTCYENPDSGLKTCRNLPTCENREWLPCTAQLSCCDGMTCVRESGRDVCRSLPSCANEWNDCRHVGCCTDGPKPLACISQSDNAGAMATCQAACGGNWQGCSADRPCCNADEYSCQDGQCKPLPTCNGNWQPCTNGMGCCDDSYSCQDDVCKPDMTKQCAGNYQACTTEGGCCDGSFTCLDDTCVPACNGNYQDCSNSLGCCSSTFSCQNNQCQPDLSASCSNDWQPCHPDGGCCSGGQTCQANGDSYQCKPAVTCNGHWQNCANGGGCCDDTYSCQDNTCKPDLSKKCVADWQICHPDGGCCSAGQTCQNNHGSWQCKP